MFDSWNFVKRILSCLWFNYRCWIRNHFSWNQINVQHFWLIIKSIHCNISSEIFISTRTIPDSCLRHVWILFNETEWVEVLYGDLIRITGSSKFQEYCRIIDKKGIFLVLSNHVSISLWCSVDGSCRTVNTISYVFDDNSVVLLVGFFLQYKRLGFKYSCWKRLPFGGVCMFCRCFDS